MIETAENQIEQLRSLLRMAANDLNAEEQRAEAAERERDRLLALLADLVACAGRHVRICDLPESWDQAMAALAAKGAE